MKNTQHNTKHKNSTCWVIILIALFPSLIIAPKVQAQAHSKQWDKTLGTNALDQLNVIQPTADGGYILGGTSEGGIDQDRTENSRGASDFWVVKLSASGTKLWDKRFGGDSEDNLNALQQTTDGGYILAGSSSSGFSGDKTQSSMFSEDAWLVKIDANGTKLWDKTFGTSDTEIIKSVQQTNDGGYIMGGTRMMGGTGNADYWIVKTDAAGTMEWEKTFGTGDADNLAVVQQTNDEGYILGGSSPSGIFGQAAGRGLGDYWIIKTDAAGIMQWEKLFGTDQMEYFRSLQQTSDGGYILGGASDGGINGDKTEASRGLSDYWIVKTDANGNKLWDKRFGSSGSEDLRKLQQTTDGGYILGGWSVGIMINGDKTQNGIGSGDFWIVKTDANGNKFWDRVYGTANDDFLADLNQTSDGAYILGSYSDSPVANNHKSEDSKGLRDYWVLKTVPLTANLSLSASPATALTNQGQTGTITYTLNNAGPDPATNAQIRVKLPSTVKFLNATVGMGTYSNLTQIWTIPNLPVGNQTITLTYEML